MPLTLRQLFPGSQQLIKGKAWELLLITLLRLWTAHSLVMKQ